MMKFNLRKMFTSFCTMSLALCMSASAFAKEAEVEAVEGSIPMEVNIGLEDIAENMKNSFSYSDEKNEESEIIAEYDVEENEQIEVNMKSRATSSINKSISSSTGEITSSNPIDQYIVQTVDDISPAIKILSDNSNLIVRLYVLDIEQGVANGTNIYDAAGDNVEEVLGNLPAGNYVLGVYSLDSSQPTGSYTLMWNFSNPGGATSKAFANNDLTKVILGYKNEKAVCCNGVNWLKDIGWEEHFTLNVGSGYTARDQKISKTQVGSVKVGKFETNKYSTNNALFIEVDEDTLWTFMRSAYSNNGGDVQHVMDYYDVAGRKTPRYLDSEDIAVGPHYIVIDINTNEVIDFASPYNYLWQTGSIKGTGTFTGTIF